MRDELTLLTDLERLKHEMEEVMPFKVSQEMVRESQRNIDNQAYLNDNVREEWPLRKYDQKPAPSGSTLGYPMLKRSGALYNSIRGITERRPRSLRVGVGSNLPYAKKQNEGVGYRRMRYKDKAYGINEIIYSIPARQFMGIGNETIRFVVDTYHECFEEVWQ